MEEYLMKEGEAFLRGWYAQIDAKVDFARIAPQTAASELTVDFPGNSLDFSGFKSWYEGQCRDFTGHHEIHSVRITEEDGLLVIFSEITWQAVGTEGKPLTLYPNVTIKLREDQGWKVVYYGCVDRQ